MYRIIDTISALFAFISLLIAEPAFAERHITSESFSLNTGNIVNSDAKRVTGILRDLGDAMVAQRDDADRKKEEKQEETTRRRNAEEDALMAPTCDPLKDRVLSLLNSAKVEPRSFNQALNTLREIEKQLPSSCPKKIQIFGSSIVDILSCYNNAIFVELADGGRYIWSERTRTFKYGPPKAKNERIMGLTDAPYYCLNSVMPVVVLSGMHIAAMARRDHDVGDRDSISSDRAWRRAREQERANLQRQEASAYQVARGNIAQLKSYLRDCNICAFRNAAQDEIAEIEKSALANAQGAGATPNRPGVWTYNGSTISLSASADKRSFSFESPSQEMLELGARQSALLFAGTRNGDRYQGTAYVYSSQCKPASYTVTGLVTTDDRKVTLIGKAPVRNSQCRIIAFRDEVMEFVFHD